MNWLFDTEKLKCEYLYFKKVERKKERKSIEQSIDYEKDSKIPSVL